MGGGKRNDYEWVRDFFFNVITMFLNWCGDGVTTL